MDASYRLADSYSLQRPLALAIAAAIVFMVANTAPLMTLSAAGLDSATTIVGGAYQMWRQGYRATAGVVLFCAVLAPAGFIVFALGSLLGASRPSAPKWLPALTRWAATLRHWAMPEVMLLALLVALTKMAGLATVIPGIGMYAAGALVVLFAMLSPVFNPEEISARPRKPGSIQRTWALIIAATICYVPANLLPVLTSNTLVSSQSDTIMSGVIYLFTSGTWPLGLIVLIASVMIPLGKLASLAYLLVSVQRGSVEHCGDRGHLLRLVDAIGRWSMLDVFVVAFVAALMQLQPLLSAQPGPGVPFFAAVVILTMLAAKSFDPRLISDAARKPQARDV
jgi:paraquat-inducible protein A